MGVEPEASTAGAPHNADELTGAAPDRERVAMRAYELYLARGGADGQDLEDWLIAERELFSGEPRRHSTGEA